MTRVFDESAEVTLSAPGKTFLCGEYLALLGGPSLILATGPRFHLKIRRVNAGEKGKNPFHPESPAGLFIQKNTDFFSQFVLEFHQPYQQGGFGASTAEFLMTRALYQFGQGIATEHQLDLDVREVLSDYRNLHSEDETLKPSGADLVGQTCGWVTAFERRSGRIQVFPWSFGNLGLLIFSTGQKLPTHEHLQAIRQRKDPSFFESLSVLEEPCQKIWDAFPLGAEGAFLVGLNELSGRLESLGLQSQSTLEACRSLRTVSGIRAVKGCGAMGADVILAIYDRREGQARDVIAKAQEIGLTLQASEADLQSGLERETLGGSPIQREIEL